MTQGSVKKMEVPCVRGRKGQNRPVRFRDASKTSRRPHPDRRGTACGKDSLGLTSLQIRFFSF